MEATHAVAGPINLPAQGTPNNWTFNNANLFFVNDHRYDITATATDNAGNKNSTTNRFVYDVAKPTSTISTPIAPYFVSLSNISGNATDNPGGITYSNPSKISTSSVQVAVKLVGGSWWNGGTSDFTGSDPDYSYFTVVNTTTSNPNSWTVSAPGGAFLAALVTGNSYRFISRTTDIASNSEFGLLNGNVPSGIGQTVLYDSAAVTATVNFPANNTAYTAISSFTGTATDTLTGSGVREIDIALIDAGNEFWNGSVWSAANACSVSCNPWQPANFVGNSSGTWSYNNLTSAFTPNADYRVYVRGIDRAGNVLPNPNFTVGGNFFAFDNVTPLSQPTSPANQSNLRAGITTISGTATDFSLASLIGVNNVSLRLGRSDGKFYDVNVVDFDNASSALNFPLAPTLSGPSGSMYTWSLGGIIPAIFADGYQYNIESKATDNAGNFETTYTTVTFIVDKSSPTAAITYPAAGGYVSQTGFVQGTSTDAIVAPGNFPSGVMAVNVRISTGGFTYFWTGSSWTSNSSTWLQTTLSPSATFWSYPQALWNTNITYTAEIYAVDRGFQYTGGLLHGQFHRGLYSADLHDHDTEQLAAILAEHALRQCHRFCAGTFSERAIVLSAQ